MKRYTLDLAAGVPVTVNVGGEFFLLDSAPLGGVTVEFFGSGNLARDVRIDSGVDSVYARPKGGFSSLRITSVALQTIAFYVAAGDVGVNRFSGAVTVNGLVSLDPEDARYTLFGDDEVMDGEAFIAGNTGGPSAGLPTIHQLFNPAASGKVGYLDKAILAPGTAATRVLVKQHNAALGALTNLGVNKNSGGAAGVCEYRQATVDAGTIMTHLIGALNASNLFEFSPAIRIPAGRGVHFTDVTNNQILLASLEWREKLT